MADASTIESLTPREREILTMIADGDSLVEIAQKLHRSLKTIESHRLSLGRKLKASNRVELAKIAIRAGLVVIDSGPSDRSEFDNKEAKELACLREITEAVRGVTSKVFIDQFCLAISRVLNVRYAAICMHNSEAEGDARFTVSYCDDGKIGAPFFYVATDKPVQTVIDHGVCKVGSNLQSRYPNDPLLFKNKIQSYVGIRLENERGISSGVLAIADNKPLENLDSIERIMRFFDARISAELEVVLQAKQVDELKKQIENQTTSANTALTTRTSKTTSQDSAEQAVEHEFEWIEQINQAIGKATGRDLLERFCTQASKLPGVNVAAVCTMDRSASVEANPYNRIIMAISQDGKSSEPVRYHAMNTPCQSIIETGQCIFNNGIREAYPDDPWLEMLAAEGYLGLQITSAQGEPLGGAGLVGLKPFTDIEALRRVIVFFIPRLAGALQTCFEMEALRDQCSLLASEIARASPSTPLLTQVGDSPSLALAEVMRRVHSLTGVTFLRGILDAISDLFDASFAGVCRLNQPDQQQTLRSVICLADKQLADTFEYPVKGTPCELTLRHGVHQVAKCACEVFPTDDVIVKNNIESYLGVRLPAPSGQPVGVFWLASREPLAYCDTLKHVMSYYGAPIGAELIELDQYEKLLDRLEQAELSLKNKANSIAMKSTH